MRLERFRWWHVDEVLPIEADLFGAEQWSAGMFWNELANGHFYLVATGPDGGLLGYAGLTVTPPDEAWVQNIAVRRSAQRRGVGRLLLEGLLAEAARRGARSTLLEVAADNAPAQRLYAEYGFEPIGVRRGYYQPSNTDALVMRRVVTSDPDGTTPTGEGTDGHG
ncbi:ribosomal-protein-alanine N-acetyltransferase [Micromonospora fluostatini]|uniref:Ribosomal-protein-alanine N-acetyltransferase n=1 Tax=Micromonospora fluostatini TaxID=1629071 RepID=A0ABY2DJ35_9ACTN|nr:ribosomal-protein-alanine N-acetyltransferase [Micromonospora fluostatini]